MDVSVVITTYNYASYIEECISSCLLQNDTSLEHEVIVVDDGSTDATPDILKKLHSKKLRKFRIENSGVEVASNFGFGKARGRYVVRVDADDKLLPNYLYYMQQSMAKEYDFYYSDYDVIDPDGRVVRTMNLPAFSVAEIQARGDFLATGTLYSADVLREIGYYSEAIRNSGLENYELILRLLLIGSVGRHIERRLFCYRRHSLSLSASKIDRIERNGFALFLRLGLGRYGVNRYHPYNPARE
jgi:glycosyltransferase involved in cell wall biosynthesis